MSYVKVYTDGSCWNSKDIPERTSMSSVSLLLDREDNLITHSISVCNHGTSNRAELIAIIDGVNLALRRGHKTIDVFTDSMYSMRVLKKDTGYVDGNYDLRERYYALLNSDNGHGCEVFIHHVNRDSKNPHNIKADKIAGTIRKTIDNLLIELDIGGN